MSDDSSSALNHPRASLFSAIQKRVPSLLKKVYFSCFPVLLKTCLLQLNAKERAEQFGEATVCVSILRAVTFFQTLFPMGYHQL